MANFLRVIRLSLRYRWTVASAVSCAMLIGLLWGTNIGTVFPFVEVVFRGQSLHEWVDRDIEKAQQKSAALQTRIDQLVQHPDQSSSKVNRHEVSALTARLDAELAALQARHWVQPYIHRYLPTTPFSTLVLVIVILLLATLVKDIFLAFSTVLTERLAQAGTQQLRKRFFQQTLQMELASFQDSHSSELISRFTYDLEQVTVGLRVLFGKTLREPLKMAACLIGAGIICWRLLLLSMIVAPIAVVTISLLNSSLKRANRKALREMSRIYSVLTDTLRGIKVVKAFAMERFERRRFDQASRRYFGRAMRVAVFDAMVRPCIEMMGMTIICIAILGGAYLVLNEETHLLGIQISTRPMSISWMMLFFGLLAGTSDPARKLAGVIGRLQRAAAAADRIYELLDRQPAMRNRPRPIRLPRHEGEIQFKNVHFRYTLGAMVLNDINLSISCGETIAVVGPNGCGKSTLASMILRFYDPTDGSVHVDGIDLRDMRLLDLRQQIGLVTQRPILFDDTVEANIRYGKPDATLAEVRSAAQKALADDFIQQQLSGGYQTIVGEAASRLSGGQLQRIALARAILRDPRILILDEATSQVDPKSEQQIHHVLADFVRDRTTIIITHRMSVLDLADRIVVMDSGRIVDVGTRSDLLAQSETFRRLAETPLRASA